MAVQQHPRPLQTAVAHPTVSHTAPLSRKRKALLLLGTFIVILTFIQVQALVLTMFLETVAPPFQQAESLRREFVDSSTSGNDRNDFIDRSQTSKPNKLNGGGAFVHIGKTGGSTLSVLLVNGCHSFMPRPCHNVTRNLDSPANRLVKSYYHVPDFGLLPNSHHDFYILTTRDPFDRVVSAFVYEHIRNRQARNDTNFDAIKLDLYKQAYSCFPTLNDFSLLLGGDDSNNFDYPYPRREVHVDSCQDFARAAFHGRVRMMNHFYFGYERIQSLLPPNQTRLFVVRQEHLWSDWLDVNQRLLQELTTDVDALSQNLRDNAQGPTENGRNSIRNTTILELRNQLPVTRSVDDSGRRSLCQALREEYKAYFDFLRRAENVGEGSEKWEISKKNAMGRCGPHLDISSLTGGQHA